MNLIYSRALRYEKSSVLYLTLQESTTTQMHTLRMGENAEELQSSGNLASRELII